MKWLNDDVTAKMRLARVCLLSTALVLGATPKINAQEETPLVSVAGKAVPKLEVEDALRQCRHNAPDVELGECIDRYWVPRWLLDERARSEKLDQTDALLRARRQILATRLTEKLSNDAPEPTDAEIEAYLQKHERDFEKPLRIRIFRILVSNENKANQLLEKLNETTTIADFRSLAREHSVDRATNERGGDLGFVWPDGSTDVPQVSAETSLYEAASELEDGEFAEAPVPEGKHFAVLWRRGSLPAETTNESSRRVARLRIIEKKAEEATRSLLAKLSEQVTNRDNELLGKLRRPEATLFREP